MKTRHHPEKTYNGLTVVLSQPSRKDLDNGYLISGYAGIIFNDALGRNATSRWSCDIRLADSLAEPLREGTKAILLLGEGALHTWCPKYLEYKISEIRGTPLESRWDIPVICSFTPQDTCDIIDFEKKYNPLLAQEGEDEDGEEGEEDTKKRHGFTQRKNYKFWFERDIDKVIHRIRGGEIYKNDYEIRIYPRMEDAIQALNSLSDSDLFFDIETDSERNITVVGFSCSNSNIIYSLPILDYLYALYYGKGTYRFFQALVSCFQRNRVVIHNSMFDLKVLLYKYRLPIGRRVWDTMLVQKRIYPEPEKSLGHGLSCHPQIWEPYHKDEGIFEPQNRDQERKLLYYNAKDIVALRLLKRAQEAFARNDPGLQASFEQANEMPYAFLINTFTGVRFDKEKADIQLALNDRLLDQYYRACRILVGPDVDYLPTSPKKVVDYFHGMLKYPVVARSKKTGEPSLGKEAMYKLMLKNPMNLVIEITLLYRALKKFSGGLKSQPLKGWHE